MGDGRLAKASSSKQEANHPSVDAAFDSMDANGDKVVTRQEFASSEIGQQIATVGALNDTQESIMAVAKEMTLLREQATEEINELRSQAKEAKQEIQATYSEVKAEIADLRSQAQEANKEFTELREAAKSIKDMLGLLRE